MTTTRDDISGLSERLRHLVSLDRPENGGPYQGYAASYCVNVMAEAAAKLDALQARVKELEKWQGIAQSTYEKFEGYIVRLTDAESRATRLQQERDEAYERAAMQAEQFAPPHSADLGKGHVAWRIAAAIRRLASGTEKEKKE